MDADARLKLLQQMLEEKGPDSFVLYAIAMEYAQKGDVDLALHYYQRLLTTDPEYIGLYYHLGKLYQRLGRLAEARQTFEAGIRRSMNRDAHACRELREALQQLEEETG